MKTALAYRFTSLAVITGATAVVGSLLVWWWLGASSFDPGTGLPSSQIFLQAWTVLTQILIYLTAVFAAGAVAMRVLAVAKGWDVDADGDIDDEPYDDGPDDVIGSD
jgi:hypothetical protein